MLTVFVVEHPKYIIYYTPCKYTDKLGSSDGGMLSSSACETMDPEHHSPGVKDINI